MNKKSLDGMWSVEYMTVRSQYCQKGNYVGIMHVPAIKLFCIQMQCSKTGLFYAGSLFYAL
jgi:hypothetical protein